jgi:hypothetical protein
MRLLNVKTFQFAELFCQTPPPYAILSHTWGDDSEEVSYRSVLAGRLDSPETGPAKVRGCCDQAHGLVPDADFSSSYGRGLRD